MILNKVNKTIRLLRKLRNMQPRSALLTVLDRTSMTVALHMTKLITVLFHQKLELLHLSCNNRRN